MDISMEEGKEGKGRREGRREGGRKEGPIHACMYEQIRTYYLSICMSVTKFESQVGFTLERWQSTLKSSHIRVVSDLKTTL